MRTILLVYMYQMKNIHICTILGYSKIMSIFYLHIARILLFHARKIVWIEDWSIYMFLFDAVFLQLLPFLFSHKFNLISEYRKTTIFDSLRIEEIFMYNPWFAIQAPLNQSSYIYQIYCRRIAIKNKYISIYLSQLRAHVQRKIL